MCNKVCNSSKEHELPLQRQSSAIVAVGVDFSTPTQTVICPLQTSRNDNTDNGSGIKPSNNLDNPDFDIAFQSGMDKVESEEGNGDTKDRENPLIGLSGGKEGEFCIKQRYESDYTAYIEKGYKYGNCHRDKE